MGVRGRGKETCFNKVFSSPPKKRFSLRTKEFFMDKFYVTTPIYYVNDKPHIGHAYTTVLADVLARFHRSLGIPTFFLTGTDEHGQKVEKAAKLRNEDPQKHCDDTVERFKDLWKRLGITNDYFIRTTNADHKKVVQEVLQELYDRGEIYKGDFKGHYCVGCERFLTEKDLVDGKCPECNRDVTEIVESNYFFRMSKYQQWLIDYIESHPKFIMPEFRANETLGFLKKELKDLCISRHKSRLSWGIELPFDSDYVCYVWFDALINYISGVGYKKDEEMFKKWWPASKHLIGKDILTTHSVYWPTMLKAMNVEMPETIFAHGWWLTGREKMSKSLGNVINPMDMVDKCGVDAFRYYLLAAMAPGQDASFTEESFVKRYNNDLANDLGNFASRVLKMTLRHSGGLINKPAEFNADDLEVINAVKAGKAAMEKAIAEMKLDQGIDSVMEIVRAGNRYMEKTAPWTLAKKGETARLETILYTAATAVYHVSVLLSPIMPEKMAELQKVLGTAVSDRIDLLDADAQILVGCTMQDSDPLFPRLQEEAAPAPAPAPKAEKKVEKKAPAENVVDLISIDDFFKTQLKTAKILEAEKIEGADKLLKLKIEVGSEIRPLVAGIALYYKPEELIGKTIVIVANLKPAKIRGVESCGMLLAAKNGNTLKLITTDGEMASGVSIG